jgi:hypothetical protein
MRDLFKGGGAKSNVHFRDLMRVRAHVAKFEGVAA